MGEALAEMGATIVVLDAAEEACVEAAEKLDPDAGLLTKGIAAVAGFKGAGALEGMLEKKEEEAKEGEQAAPDDAAPQA
mgnify:CR=1 FL=1